VVTGTGGLGLFDKSIQITIYFFKPASNSKIVMNLISFGVG